MRYAIPNPATAYSTGPASTRYSATSHPWVAAGIRTPAAVPELLLQDLAAVRTMPDADVRDASSFRAGLGRTSLGSSRALFRKAVLEWIAPGIFGGSDS